MTAWYALTNIDLSERKSKQVRLLPFGSELSEPIASHLDRLDARYRELLPERVDFVPRDGDRPEQVAYERAAYDAHVEAQRLQTLEALRAEEIQTAGADAMHHMALKLYLRGRCSTEKPPDPRASRDDLNAETLKERRKREAVEAKLARYEQRVAELEAQVGAPRRGPGRPRSEQAEGN